MGSGIDVDMAKQAFDDLDGWIGRNGWSGYDPYDVRGQDWFFRLFGGYSPVGRKARAVMTKAERALPPAIVRRCLGIQKAVNAKGMGLLASGYLSRFANDGDVDWKRKAEAVLEWLRTNYSKGYSGLAWGYPFHWLSRMPIPRDTPSVVVTCVVGDAWLRHYELTGAQESLRVGEQIADFILQDLNRSTDNCGGICFSYTPLDSFKVHNANLFAAQFLARLSVLTGCGEYGDLATQAVQYTLREQNDDGSFVYWSREPESVIDHYHTGFVLRHLNVVHRSLGQEKTRRALERGFDFYVTNLFDSNGVPKHTVSKAYPIDIHSCAEALLCLSRVGREFGSIDMIPKVLDFTLREMRHDEGWFIARIEKGRFGFRRVEIPYMRWGQAWMILALAEMIEGDSR